MIKSLLVRKSSSLVQNNAKISENSRQTLNENQNNLKANVSHSDEVYVRVLSSRVGAGESVAGKGIDIVDTDLLVPFSRMVLGFSGKSDNICAMKVDGYSMIPMLYPDSWVIARIGAAWEGDGLYVIDFDGNFMVKLLQKAPNGVLRIKSVNPGYDSYEIGADDQRTVRIIGKVLRCVI